MPHSFAELVASIEASPLPFVVTDPNLDDNPVVAVNGAFLFLTGYEAGEVAGRNCRFLQGPDSEESARATVRAAIAAGSGVLAEIVNYRKDGSAFRNAMMIAPIRDEAGKVAFFLGSQLDLGVAYSIADRRRLAQEAVARLPARQAEVLRELARGQRGKQIAHRLGISEEMVKRHRAALKQSLGVRTVAEAIRLAIEAGL